MPALRVLGQAAGTGALTALYAPAAGRQAVTSTLILLNRSKDPDAVGVAVRVAVAPAGATDVDTHTVLDWTLDPGERLTVAEGWALAPGDVVRFKAPTTVIAHLFGQESTPS